MLIDIIGQGNTVSFNCSIAAKIGLNAAVYLSELLKIYGESEAMGKTNNGYFLINRSNIFYRTTLDESTQQQLDILLVRLNLLLKRNSLEDPMLEEVSINMNNLINLFTSDDEKLTKDIIKISTSKSKGNISQRDKYKLELKGYIKCTNAELLQAYRDWVDGVYANPKGFLSKRAIDLFQQNIDNFAKGDLDLALKLVDIATINGYRDADWAINKFKKDYEKDFNRDRMVKFDPIQGTRTVTLSDEVF